MSQQAAVAADALHTPADQVRVNRHRADWRGWKFMWPFALVFVFVFVIPILYAIYISFFQTVSYTHLTLPTNREV